MKSGVVPGGGTTLLRIANKLNADKSVGHKILKAALVAPFYQILENIGYDIAKDNPQALAEILKNKNKVYDARNKKVKNAMTAGNRGSG